MRLIRKFTSLGPAGRDPAGLSRAEFLDLSRVVKVAVVVVVVVAVVLVALGLWRWESRRGGRAPTPVVVVRPERAFERIKRLIGRASLIVAAVVVLVAWLKGERR